MKINFHNKLEILVGDRYYVSYNKVLRSLYGKLSRLESYADYFALGTGKSELSDSATNLGAYLMTIPTQTIDMACNPEDGVYYVKKSATFPLMI